MKKEILAKSTEEFDRSFDKGEDIYDLIDMSKATVIHDFSFEFLRKSCKCLSENCSILSGAEAIKVGDNYLCPALSLRGYPFLPV